MTTEEERERNASTDNIRRVLAEGFAFVRGNEVTEAVSASTFEHTLVRAINDIEEDVSEIRPSKLTAIRSMKQAVIDAVTQARSMPASAFELSSDSAQTANTREDGSGPEPSDDG
jgi:hypothetical protein